MKRRRLRLGNRQVSVPHSVAQDSALLPIPRSNVAWHRHSCLCPAAQPRVTEGHTVRGRDARAPSVSYRAAGRRTSTV